MIKVVADDKIPFLSGLLEPKARVVYLPGNQINSESLADADALITRTRTTCDEKLLKGTKVKFIATATIGYDHINTDWCNQNGIVWTNAPGCNSGSVMQYLASLLVFLSKKFNFQFEDKTLGVIGVGNVGSKVVRMAEALGMRVVLNDPPFVRKNGTCGYISLDGLFREADIITIHTPLNYEGVDKTYRLFDYATLKKLMKGSILINTARGEIIENSALVKVLDENHILAAALDVWENEPDIDNGLLNMVSIATPHIAGYSADGKLNGTLMSVKAINNYFRLGIKMPSATSLPVTGNMEIDIDCKDLPNQEILSQVIEATYRIQDDDSLLRNNPNDFEYFRGNYRIRREFQAYKVNLLNANPDITWRLKRLGFHLE